MSGTNNTNATNTSANQLACAQNCPYKSAIEDLQKDSTKNSEQHREFYNKLSNQDKQIAISEERYSNLLACVSEIKTSISSIQGSIEELKSKPAKRWETVISCIISSIVGLVVGLLFKSIGG